jgi:putative ubiquitin-RnfH superfamily antitoxin RatB of RatAB toxin-antitoxin module
MWGAKYSLSPGAAISANDLEVEKVSLGTQAPKYFSSKAKIVGSYLTKSLAQGELIPVSAVSKINNGVSLKEVPLGINKSDMPSNLRIGDLVDLYSIPIKDPKALTHLVTSKIRVVGLDTQSQNLGGVVNLLLSVDKDVLLDITDAIQMGRIVVVRNAL